MHLIHRNRVRKIAPSIRVFLPLRFPFPSGEGSSRHPKMDDRSRRMRQTSLPRWGRGTAAEAETSSASFNDAVAVDEVHHTDALSHLRKCKRG